jgi:hypothetical protein
VNSVGTLREFAVNLPVLVVGGGGVRVASTVLSNQAWRRLETNLELRGESLNQ